MGEAQSQKLCLNPTPYNLHPTPYTLHPNPHACRSQQLLQGNGLAGNKGSNSHRRPLAQETTEILGPSHFNVVGLPQVSVAAATHAHTETLAHMRARARTHTHTRARTQQGARPSTAATSIIVMNEGFC